MKKTSPTFITFLLIYFVIYGSIAQEVEQFPLPRNHKMVITHQNENSLTIVFSSSSPILEKIEINNSPFDFIPRTVPYLPGEAGKPDLPSVGRMIAIPPGAEITFHINSVVKESIKHVELAPAPDMKANSETGSLNYSWDSKTWSVNRFYPASPVIISKTSKMREIDVASLNLIPYQYNPVSKELIVFRELELTIEFLGGTGWKTDDKYRNIWWEPILAGTIFNYNSLPEIETKRPIYQRGKEVGAEYLIICPNGEVFQQWADTIRLFRTTQGILSKVVTLNEIGGNSVDLIEAYINEAYISWDIPPAGLLLLGDHGTDINNRVISPIWDNYCVSDNIYGDVIGNNLPDIVTARLPAKTSQELETMITRFINNERNPPDSPDFYDHPITSCLFTDNGYNQLLTESIAGFYETILAKNTNRINVGPNPIPNYWTTNPDAMFLVDYFGPEGLGYIPALPSQVNCTWASTGEDLKIGINNGAFTVINDSYGSEQGWGSPEFSNGNIDQLTNLYLPQVWSPNCLTGKFNYSSDCFAEKFLKHKYQGENSGALCVIAPSEVTYSFANWILMLGAFDHMWPQYLPEFGQTPEMEGVYPAFSLLASKYFLFQSSWAINTNNKVPSYHLYHFFGDAFTAVYTEIPQELTVEHQPELDQGETTFDINANEGSLIALSVNGELLATAIGTGSMETLEIPAQNPPDQILVTVSMHNHYRYESYVPVVLGTNMNADLASKPISIYPNPADKYISLEIKKDLGITHVLLLSSLNKTVYSNKIELSSNSALSIDIAEFPPGLYYLVLKSEMNTIVRKMVFY